MMNQQGYEGYNKKNQLIQYKKWEKGDSSNS